MAREQLSGRKTLHQVIFRRESHSRALGVCEKIEAWRGREVEVYHKGDRASVTRVLLAVHHSFAPNFREAFQATNVQNPAPSVQKTLPLCSQCRCISSASAHVL